MNQKNKPNLLKRQPKTKKGQETQDLILKAAAQILLKEGMDSLNTNRIAEKAGISIGSLYQYFPNKETILDQLVEENVTRRSEKIRQSFDLKSTFESMETLVTKVIDAIFNIDNPEDFELERRLLSYMAVQKVNGAEFYLRRSDNLLGPMIKALIIIKNPQLISRDIDSMTFVLNQSVRGCLVGMSIYNENPTEVAKFKKEIVRMICAYLK
jgi:AcrR family transcriptional regulator